MSVLDGLTERDDGSGVNGDNLSNNSKGTLWTDWPAYSQVLQYWGSGAHIAASGDGEPAIVMWDSPEYYTVDRVSARMNADYGQPADAMRMILLVRVNDWQYYSPRGYVVRAYRDSFGNDIIETLYTGYYSDMAGWWILDQQVGWSIYPGDRLSVQMDDTQRIDVFLNDENIVSVYDYNAGEGGWWGVGVEDTFIGINHIYYGDPNATPSGAALVWVINDSLALTDAQVARRGYSRTIADTLALADAQATTKAMQRIIADALGLADGQALVRAAFLSIADTLALADGQSKAVGLAIADTLALADSETGSLITLVTVNDVLGLADQLTPSAGYFAAVADVLGLADDQTPLRTYLRLISDLLGLDDGLPDPAMGFERTQADTLGLGDALSTAADYRRQIDDALALTEVLATASGYVRSVADALALADDLVPLHFTGEFIQRTISDALGIDDTVDSTRSYARLLSDVLSLDDSVESGAGFVRAITDALGLGDDLGFNSEFVRLIEDQLGVTDAITRASTIYARVDDALEVVDLLIVNPGGPVRILSVRAYSRSGEVVIEASAGRVHIDERSARVEISASKES